MEQRSKYLTRECAVVLARLRSAATRSAPAEEIAKLRIEFERLEREILRGRPS